MKPFFCFLTSLCLLGQVHAQIDSTLIVKAGTTINQSVAFDQLYVYPQFTRGKVYFKDGKASDALLNLNRFLDEMQFIMPRGDTMTIDGEELLKYVVIQQDTFYYDRGYLRLVSSMPHAKLALKVGLKVIDRQKMGAYGMSSSTSAINSFSSINDGSRMYNLTVREEMILARYKLFYLGNKNDNFLLANRKNLMGLFPKHESAIRMYLKENAVDFQKKEDLDKLLLFLASL